MVEPIMKHLPGAKAFTNGGLVLGWLCRLNQNLGEFHLTRCRNGKLMFTWTVERSGKVVSASRSFAATAVAWADPKQFALELNTELTREVLTMTGETSKNF